MKSDVNVDSWQLHFSWFTPTKKVDVQIPALFIMPLQFYDMIYV